MKFFWCIFVMVSVLFMSVDGAADMVMKGHPHSDGAVHQSDSGVVPNADQPGDIKVDDDHCERCCHGHSTGVSPMVASMMTPFVKLHQRSGRSAHARSFAQAPPTPPPNA